MIQISRHVARELKVVLRKLFGRNRPDVRLIAGPEGLRCQAKGGFYAAEYHDSGPREPADLTIPYALLEDVQGPKIEPVRISCPKKKVLAATWEDRGVERTMQYSLPKADETKFPEEPALFCGNQPTMIQALSDAARSTDSASSRYALGCIQLRGNAGQIAATDGKQLLLQSLLRDVVPI